MPETNPYAPPGVDDRDEIIADLSRKLEQAANQMRIVSEALGRRAEYLTEAADATGKAKKEESTDFLPMIVLILAIIVLLFVGGALGWMLHSDMIRNGYVPPPVTRMTYAQDR